MNDFDQVVGDDGKKLPHTMDARVWANGWLATIAEHPSVPTDEGTMIGWFSNSIMAGYDEAQRRAAKENTELRAKMQRAREHLEQAFFHSSLSKKFEHQQAALKELE